MTTDKATFNKFEIQAESVGRIYLVRGRVEQVRVGRGRKEVMAEAWFNDCFNHMEFRNRGAETFLSALERIFDQIDYRGFIPKRVRLYEKDRWTKWRDIEGYPKDPIHTADKN